MAQVWKHFIPSHPQSLSISGSPPSTDPQIATSNRIHPLRHPFTMESPKRERVFPQGSPRRSPKAMRPGAARGADENTSPKHLVAVGAASSQRKKVLGERNDGGVGVMKGATAPPVQQPKPAPSPPTLAGHGAGPYDPKTNYTMQRPTFRCYDPERRREILLRVSRAADVMHDDCSSTTSGTAASEEDGDSLASDAAAASPISSAPRSDSEAELDDGEEEEEEEEVVPARRGGWARRLFLLLVAVSCTLCYIYCMNPAAFPTYSEDALGFVGGIGGLYDAGDHERESLGLLGPVYMMGPEDVPKGSTNQIVHEDTKRVDHLVSVTAMGLADICLNVSLGELTCQVGSERSENVSDLKEYSEMDILDTEGAISFQNDNQSSEVDWSGGNVPLDSISSTTTQTNEEEGSSESVHLEEWEDCSNQCVLQLVSMEKAIKSASDKMEDKKVESEELDLWQYENTAEAAKTICSGVKFLWSAMEPHLLQILACLSFACLVAALYRYYQRSRECCNCIITYDSLAEQPLLDQHQVVLLPVTSSVQDADLPVHSSEQPMQLTIPNQGLAGSLEVPMELTLPMLDPLVSLEDPVQESLPKTDPLVTHNVPVIGHGIHDQKLKQGDPEKVKASNGSFLKHSDVDSSKAPVVELLGEFMFANSSRGRSIKRLNQNAGDATVQELLEHLGKDEDVEKMQVHSSIIQSPSVQGAKKEEKSVRLEKTDATPTPLTPTPLRRSSRLRSKVTSP
ncbi:uncharacterized protein LOC8079251 isoform X2 [Sorghum bicolor]|uniref:Uncharacterized protein n=1 Tax=Sorghum bicolor TaxID=4558 RepID=A0A1B6Q6A2_SORBI|nr:uncharacterized protein LOC8079251 isoform X2 [Sorghum bicolor]KXG33446.1 hypothetical protein SORBI_3003G307200 [Sorghum bicolor]|eukprot:XP_021313676.1 uncharacterized protein LOC8079251 isoform X2 [Sorghum bicolor]